MRTQFFFLFFFFFFTLFFLKKKKKKMGSSLSQHEKKRRKSLLNQNRKQQEETVSSSSTLTRSPLASSDSVVVDGRTYHGEASSVYWLPNDDEELDRLVGVSTNALSILYCVTCLLFLATLCYENLVWRVKRMKKIEEKEVLIDNRNIPKEVHKHVDMEKGIKILDLGCGPRTWIMVERRKKKKKAKLG